MGYTLVQTQPASSDSEIDFTIDGTYDEIMFVVTNYKPVTDEQELEWQVITSSYGSYNRGIQSANNELTQRRDDTGLIMGVFDSVPWWQHSSDAETQGLSWGEGSTSANTGGNAAQMSGNGELIIYRPQETAHWKHFSFRSSNSFTGNYTLAQSYSYNLFGGGYIKEAEALTGIRFNTRSGNISVGTFSMYGLS